MQDRHSPMRTGRFTIEIDQVQVDGFRVVDLPARSTNVKDERGRGNVWGQTEYEDLTMERGVQKGDTTLYDWRNAVDQGKLDQGRRNLAVELQDELGAAVIRWEFTNAWPRKYTPPQLAVSTDSGQGDIATEEVTVVFDEMKRTK